MKEVHSQCHDIWWYVAGVKTFFSSLTSCTVCWVSGIHVRQSGTALKADNRFADTSQKATGLLAGEHVRTPVHLCWTGIKDWYFADQIIAGSELVCSLEIELYNHCFLDIIEIVYYVTIDSDSNFS